MNESDLSETIVVVCLIYWDSEWASDITTLSRKQRTWVLKTIATTKTSGEGALRNNLGEVYRELIFDTNRVAAGELKNHATN